MTRLTLSQIDVFKIIRQPWMNCQKDMWIRDKLTLCIHDMDNTQKRSRYRPWVVLVLAVFSRAVLVPGTGCSVARLAPIFRQIWLQRPDASVARLAGNLTQSGNNDWVSLFSSPGPPGTTAIWRRRSFFRFTNNSNTNCRLPSSLAKFFCFFSSDGLLRLGRVGQRSSATANQHHYQGTERHACNYLEN